MSKQWTEQDVLKILAVMKSLEIDSLDREIDTTSDNPRDRRTLGDTIQDTGPDPQELAEQKELHEILLKAVQQLKPRQEMIIKLRFGLETGQPMTLDEVGQLYGVTRERIRQVETKALEKLRWLLLTKYKIKEIKK